MTWATTARLIALHVLTSALVATGTSLWVQRYQMPRFGTLDIAELYRIKEQQVAAVLVKRDSGDTDRVQAIQGAAAFGAQVSKILETLPQDCDCLVVAPGALLGSPTRLVDLTQDVRRRLGLEIRP